MRRLDDITDSMDMSLSELYTIHFHALEEEMATHSSTLAWKIPWREEPGRLQSMEIGKSTRLNSSHKHRSRMPSSA